MFSWAFNDLTGLRHIGDPHINNALVYKRLRIGVCRWMGSYFHNWIDYHGVAFSIELLEWDRTFSDFWARTVLPIYG